jgi:hypothetical protein
MTPDLSDINDALRSIGPMFCGLERQQFIKRSLKAGYEIEEIWEVDSLPYLRLIETPRVRLIRQSRQARRRRRNHEG